MLLKPIPTLGICVALLSSTAALADGTPQTMMDECRGRASVIFNTSVDSIDVKYEGQRTDGTHAVNGTSYARNPTETFQCSFRKDGYRIVQFIVNRPE